MGKFYTLHELTKVASAGDILVVTPKVTTENEALEKVNRGVEGYQLSVVEEITDSENLNIIQFGKSGSVKYASFDHTKAQAIKNAGGHIMLIRPPNADKSLEGIQKLAERKIKGRDLAAAGIAGTAAAIPGGIHTYKELKAVNEAIQATNEGARSKYKKTRAEALKKLPQSGWKKWIMTKLVGDVDKKIPKELPKNIKIPTMADKVVRSKSLKSALLWGAPTALGTLGVIALSKKKGKKEKTANVKKGLLKRYWGHLSGAELKGAARDVHTQDKALRKTIKDATGWTQKKTNKKMDKALRRQTRKTDPKAHPDSVADYHGLDHHLGNKFMAITSPGGTTRKGWDGVRTYRVGATNKADNNIVQRIIQRIAPSRVHTKRPTSPKVSEEKATKIIMGIQSKVDSHRTALQRLRDAERSQRKARVATAGIGAAGAGAGIALPLSLRKKGKSKTAADRAPGEGPQKWETDPTPALDPLTWLARFRKKARNWDKRKKSEREARLAKYKVRLVARKS